MSQNLDKAAKLLKLADASFEKGDFERSVSYYSNAIKISETYNKDESFAKILAGAKNGMGHVLRSKGDFERSKKFQEEALYLYRRLIKRDESVKPELALSLHYLGDILADLGKRDKALEYYKEELKIARELYYGDKEFLSYLIYGMNGVASNIVYRGEFREALGLLNLSLRYLKSVSKDKKTAKRYYPNLSWTYHLIGTTHLKRGDIADAISNLKISLEMRKQIAKNPKYIGALKNTLIELGDAYSKNGEKKEAKRYYNDALKIITSKKYKQQVISSKVLAEEKNIKAKAH